VLFVQRSGCEKAEMRLTNASYHPLDHIYLRGRRRQGLPLDGSGGTPHRNTGRAGAQTRKTRTPRKRGVRLLLPHRPFWPGRVGPNPVSS